MNHFISLHTQPKYLIKRFNIIASTTELQIREVINDNSKIIFRISH